MQAEGSLPNCMGKLQQLSKQAHVFKYDPQRNRKSWFPISAEWFIKMWVKLQEEEEAKLQELFFLIEVNCVTKQQYNDSCAAEMPSNLLCI